MFSLGVQLARSFYIEEIIVELHSLTGIEFEWLLPFFYFTIDVF